MAPALQALVSLPGASTSDPRAALQPGPGQDAGSHGASAKPAALQQGRDVDPQAPDASPSSDVHTTAACARPQALLVAYYHQKCRAVQDRPLPSNVAMCQPPDGGMGCDGAVQEARRVFERILPGLDMFASDAQSADESDEEAIEALDSALERLEQPATLQNE